MSLLPPCISAKKKETHSRARLWAATKADHLRFMLQAAVLGLRVVVKRKWVHAMKLSSDASFRTPRVLVVGAGVTGAYAANAIASAAKGEVEIEIWEKARGAGGRMSTKRASLESCSGGRCDTGAQYVTRHPSTEGLPAHDTAYDRLLRSGTLRPWGNADDRIGGVDARRRGVQNVSAWWWDACSSVSPCRSLLCTLPFAALPCSALLSTAWVSSQPLPSPLLCS